MSELTREYFDKKLGEQTEELAGIVKKGFDAVDDQLANIVQKLDVRERVEKLEKNMHKLEHALNIKL